MIEQQMITALRPLTDLWEDEARMLQVKAVAALEVMGVEIEAVESLFNERAQGLVLALV